MTENAPHSLTQILSAYQQFLLCYENPVWAKNADVEDIKSAFKLGLFIEKSVENFKNKGCFESFYKLLEAWCKDKSLKVHKEPFFALANDRVLEKLFKFPKIKETTLDIGVRMYTSMYPKERFKKCIETLIITSSSQLAIAEFVNTSLNDPSSIEHRIILTTWSELLTLNHKETLKLEIDGYLSLYKVETKLPTIFSLLSVQEGVSEPEKSVQTLVLECLKEKMLDRSILSQNFWTVLFQKVDPKCLAVSAKHYPDFLHSLLNFIEFVGSMMKKDDEDQWESDPSVCFCPSISHFDIVKVLKEICSDTSLKNQVLIILHEIKGHSNGEFWTELIGQICDQ